MLKPWFNPKAPKIEVPWFDSTTTQIDAYDQAISLANGQFENVTKEIKVLRWIGAGMTGTLIILLGILIFRKKKK